METRKLQQVGGGTYTVSIPKDWAVNRGLGAGSEVYLFSHDDGSIVIKSNQEDVEPLVGVRIDIDREDPNLVKRVLRAAHVAGFEQVTVHSESKFTDEQRRITRSAKRRLVGFEMVEEGPHEITFQNLLHAPDVSVRQSVVQLQFVSLSVHRRAMAALVVGETIDQDRLRERTEEATRLSRMVARHFSRSLVSMAEVDHLGIGRPNLFDYYVTAEALARICDLSVTVAAATVEFDSPLTADVTESFERTSDIVQQVLDASTTAVLEDSSMDTVCEVLDRCDDAADAIETIHWNAFDDHVDGGDPSSREVRALTRALDAMTRIVDQTALIAEVALRTSMRDSMDSELGP